MDKALTALLLIIALAMPVRPKAGCKDIDAYIPRVALRTNLLHDLLLTPDIGAETAIAQRWSVLLQGMWTRLGGDTSTHCMHISGGSAEMRWWFGRGLCSRALTGHHAGIYGNMIKFDFEAGGSGRQSAGWFYGTGVSYGYSLKMARRLNLDLSARAGWCGGDVIHYRPLCGVLAYNGSHHRYYFGLTGLEVTLVWFPGKGHRNNPDY